VLQLFPQAVFFKPENVGYHYKYAEPSLDTSYVPKYHWEQLDWEECTARCGGGVTTAKWDCIEEKAGKVSDSLCSSLGKPEVASKSCNSQPCKTKYCLKVCYQE
jgi:hypothetical protein